MKYRHSFHAGNFADVHKHVALQALLRAIQRKDKGFLYLDTHAGAGRYDLSAPESHHGAEARNGITPLTGVSTAPDCAEISDYLDAVAALRGEIGDAHLYPG